MNMGVKKSVYAAALAILLPMFAQAAPLINSPILFTEVRNATSVNPAGQTLIVGATTVTPSGPGTTMTATHVPGGSGPDYVVNFVSSPAFPNQYATRTAYVGQTGQWDLAATDGTGTSTVRTHVLDDVRIMPFVTGVTVSGPQLTPTISWDPVNAVLFPNICIGGPTPGCDVFAFAVEVRQITNTPGNPAPLVFSSTTFLPTTLAAPSFTLTPGTLMAGIDYLLGVRFQHFDYEPLGPGGSLITVLENRSTYLVEYSTAAAPAPGTLLLLSLGLTGALVIRRRKQAVAG